MPSSVDENNNDCRLWSTYRIFFITKICKDIVITFRFPELIFERNFHFERFQGILICQSKCLTLIYETTVQLLNRNSSGIFIRYHKTSVKEKNKICRGKYIIYIFLSSYGFLNVFLLVSICYSKDRSNHDLNHDQI